EPYVIGSHKIYHFDLYRLEDPEELEYIGFDDFFEGEPLCLIEWPEKGRGYLPECDLIVELTLMGLGRLARIESKTKRGERILIELTNAKKIE
ncbi:MAG: tRNA (adenosine(37)-N6)-threonylcarbamoyltransferase complex ATPase subunit type 1 TsaE, partial [Gammaproteobacteria bacterium]|nr:tRNA (adenosine(37)-N6)-threonylcarbamoyltransferase complex ATPase subunit type 1 TsaE [Gammaproteobacteria bacterium]